MTSPAVPSRPLSTTAAETAATAAARATLGTVEGMLLVGTFLLAEKQQNTLDAAPDAKETHLEVELASRIPLNIKRAPTLTRTAPPATL